MTSGPSATVGGFADAFRHEALFYDGPHDFAARGADFVREGLQADEPVLVVASAANTAALRDALGSDASAVQFADMAEVGRNPARIIPVWRDFVGRHTAAGERVRGIGEPVWAGRTPDELVECRRHESLLNVAFAGAPAWWLLCPYDVGRLDPAVVRDARRTHPYVFADGVHRPSPAYTADESGSIFDHPLPPTPPDAPLLSYEAATIRAVRAFVGLHATAYGLSEDRVSDLALAAHEVAINSIRHARAGGMLTIWRQNGTVVCELRDAGFVDEPLAGRRRPDADREDGRGLWLVNQLCDLVQLRTAPDGTVVRLHVAVG